MRSYARAASGPCARSSPCRTATAASKGPTGSRDTRAGSHAEQKGTSVSTAGGSVPASPPLAPRLPSERLQQDMMVLIVQQRLKQQQSMLALLQQQPPHQEAGSSLWGSPEKHPGLLSTTTGSGAMPTVTSRVCVRARACVCARVCVRARARVLLYVCVTLL